MIGQLIALLKTLLMKDADPSELNKPWWKRRRIIQGVVATVGFVLYYKWGLVLDNDAKDMIWDNYQVIVSSLEAAIAAVMALWGVIGTIAGHVGATKKLKVAIAECQKPPQPIKAPDKVEPADPNPMESPRN